MSQPIIVLFLLIAMCIGSGQPTLQPINATPSPFLRLRIPHAPIPVSIQGQTTLFYELHLTNQSALPLSVSQIDVIRSSDSKVITTYIGDQLKRRLMVVGQQPDSTKIALIQPDSLAILYIELVINGAHSPTTLSHRVAYSTTQSTGSPLGATQGAELTLKQHTPLVLGPPLSGGPWAAVYNPFWERGHRRVLFTQRGTSHIPGRFAIDFVKLDAQGRLTTHNQDSVKYWHGYAQPVLAVASGVVSSVRNDFVESVTLSAHPRYPPELATGNYVSLRVAPNRYVFYEHLKPGSIRVQVGQRVKQGEVIAQLGFTGQSTGPHLHLHVADGDSPLGAEGVPFVFKQFTRLGGYDDFNTFGKARWQPLSQGSVRRITHERPGPNEVMDFD